MAERAELALRHGEPDRTIVIREDDRMATRGHTRNVLFTPITQKRHISTTSVIRHGKEETLHDYTVRVTVNDITSPLVEIHTGDDAALTGEVTSTLDVIIRSNRG